MAGVERVGVFADTLALERVQSAMPADARDHWDRAKERREINGFGDCVCYLCLTMMELEKRIESWST